MLISRRDEPSQRDQRPKGQGLVKQKQNHKGEVSCKPQGEAVWERWNHQLCPILLRRMSGMKMVITTGCGYATITGALNESGFGGMV